MKKDCHKKMKHVACSYKDEKNEDKSADHEWAILPMHDDSKVHFLSAWCPGT